MARKVYKTKSAAQDARRKGYTVRKRKGGYSLYRVKPSKKSTVKKRKSPSKKRKTTTKRKSPSKKRKSSKKLYKTKTAAKNARRKGYTVRKRKGGYSLYKTKPSKKTSSKRKSPSKKRTSSKRRSSGTRTSSALGIAERKWGENVMAGIPRWQRSMTSGAASKAYVKGVSRFTGLKASTVSSSKPATRHRASAKRAGATASVMRKNVGLAKKAKTWSKNYKKAFMKK